MADKDRPPAVAGMKRMRLALLLSLLLLSACVPPATAAPVSSAATERPMLVLHWMSWSHHSEPRYQLLFEGGNAGTFDRLRLLTPDGTIVAEAGTSPSAATMHMCGPTKSDPSPTPYGALRVTLTLASQEQLSAVIRQPDRYRVEVASGGQWQRASLVVECHAQE